MGRVKIDVCDVVSAQGEAHRHPQVQEMQGVAGVGYHEGKLLLLFDLKQIING
jgi:hypothetical protein